MSLMTRRNLIPPLDAHAHIDPSRTSNELADSGIVLAMTLSLNEASQMIHRREPNIVWGVGCHPRKPKSEESFEPERFRELAEQTAVVGEIGLDTGSRVPIEKQLKTFREVLRALFGLPRIVSIHSYQANKHVIDELRQNPISAPILHWWTGTVEETLEAVRLGCYFSVHSAVARHSKFRTAVPRERILIESDHGWADPPAAIPCRIEWVEYLLSAQLRMNVDDIRGLVWRNFATIVNSTNTRQLLPNSFTEVLDGLKREGQTTF
jgi:TatD DNase family protein